MVDELDASIARVLARDLPKDVHPTPVAVSFATPTPEFPPESQALPVINFFLYDLRQNLGLRRNERIIERAQNGSVRRTPSPVPMDASYMITVWTDPKTETAVSDEHRIFTAVLQVLMAHPTLSAEDLGDSMKGQTAPACTVGPGLLQDPSQVREALAGRQKLTTTYTVTFPLPVLGPEDTKIVTDKRIELTLLQEVKG
jgi:Pvc16 N-terminal domain